MILTFDIRQNMCFNSFLSTFQNKTNFFKFIDIRKAENKLKAMARKREYSKADYEDIKDKPEYKEHKKQYYLDNKEIIAKKRFQNKETKAEYARQHRLKIKLFKEDN